MVHILTVDVTFGDCDPAGIVFYPNIFRWMDAAFHRMLRPLGGHARLCEDLGGVGLGLVDASSKFRGMIRNEDSLDIHMHIVEWSQRSFTLGYEGHVGERMVFEGREVRCLFIVGERGIIAGETTALRKKLEGPE